MHAAAPSHRRATVRGMLAACSASRRMRSREQRRSCAPRTGRRRCHSARHSEARRSGSTLAAANKRRQARPAASGLAIAHRRAERVVARTSAGAAPPRARCCSTGRSTSTPHHSMAARQADGIHAAIAAIRSRHVRSHRAFDVVHIRIRPDLRDPGVERRRSRRIEHCAEIANHLDAPPDELVGTARRSVRTDARARIRRCRPRSRTAPGQRAGKGGDGLLDSGDFHGRQLVSHAKCDGLRLHCGHVGRAFGVECGAHRTDAPIGMQVRGARAVSRACSAISTASLRARATASRAATSAVSTRDIAASTASFGCSFGLSVATGRVRVLLSVRRISPRAPTRHATRQFHRRGH